MKLISNGFGYQLLNKEATIWYSEIKHPIASKANKLKKGEIINRYGIASQLSFETETKDFYYSFSQLKGLNNSIVVLLEDKRLKKEYVKWKLFDALRESFIIDLHQFGSDLVLYRKNSRPFNSEWDSFSSYNLVIREWEIFISIGSKNTLVSKDPIMGFVLDESPLYKGIYDGLVIHKDFIGESRVNCIASKEVKVSENLYSSPDRPKYSEYFQTIKNIYYEFLNFTFDGVKLFQDGFRSLEESRDYFQVARTYNVMMFGGGKTDVNVSNGLKKYGPYEAPDALFSNLEFVFIYSSKEKVTELHNNLRYGKGYFTGLERYVKIPFRAPDKEMILKYESNELDSLPVKVNSMLSELIQKYPNKTFFALVLLPESKKDNTNLSDGHEAHYFDLKKVLLKLKVNSQFIDEREIEKNNFVFWLPNIAIAMLAKLGGVPWKLNRENERELIIGFGAKRKDNKTFIGSTIFFDNSGKLKSSKFFTSDEPNDFVSVLVKSILEFIKDQIAYPERLIIHYYKIPGSKEINDIDYALRRLDLNIPFVIVTINDSRSKDYIAFDETYNYGMPISGIAWKVSPNEYVLFNNTRYEIRPTQGKPPVDEYPIKLKLYFFNIQNNTEVWVK
jgi:hypothetical protein